MGRGVKPYYLDHVVDSESETDWLEHNPRSMTINPFRRLRSTTRSQGGDGSREGGGESLLTLQMDWFGNPYRVKEMYR